MRRLLPILWLVLGPLLLVGGCSKPPPPPQDPARVLTTVYAMADIVRQIGGERVNVTWWVESGQSLDLLSETPERRQQWRSADLVVTRGQLDAWTTQGVGNAYQDRRILRVDTLPSALNGDATTYLWLDPKVALEIAQEVTDRLCALDPKGEQLFQHNRDAFVQQVETLTRQAKTAIDGAGGGPFLTLDRGFLPLAKRFGLTEVRLDQQIDPTRPTSFSVRMLRNRADDAGAGAAFANAEAPAALLRDWEDRLGMPVLPLDALGTSAGSGRNTYLALLRYNLDQLERGAKLSSGRKPTSAPSGPATEASPAGAPVAPASPAERSAPANPRSATETAPFGTASPRKNGGQ